jgi:hypothetical protein
VSLNSGLDCGVVHGILAIVSKNLVCDIIDVATKGLQRVTALRIKRTSQSNIKKCVRIAFEQKEEP